MRGRLSAQAGTAGGTGLVGAVGGPHKAGRLTGLVAAGVAALAMPCTQLVQGL